MSEKIEYRVRPVVRYVVTRYHESVGGHTGGSEQKGEYANADTAFEVANALCLEEQRQFEPESAPEFVFPKRVEQGAQIGGDTDAAKKLAERLKERAVERFSRHWDGTYLAPDLGRQMRESYPFSEKDYLLHEPAYIKISFQPSVPGAPPEGYMSAQSSFPACVGLGETWRRGNDLPDGPFNTETFQRILERMKEVLREHGMEG